MMSDAWNDDLKCDHDVKQKTEFGKNNMPFKLPLNWI